MLLNPGDDPSPLEQARPKSSPWCVPYTPPKSRSPLGDITCCNMQVLPLQAERELADSGEESRACLPCFDAAIPGRGKMS